ncbi:MAG: hypothetical protein OEL83_11035 [Desulforhopalus sp.]|nr:hypothetical protein [Desulforhopalus sp.]
MIVAAEGLMFCAMLLVIWLDEFVDVPYLFFGSPSTPFRMAEYIFETATCTIVGLVIIGSTILYLRKNEKIERFIRVCAWCRKIKLDNQWIPMESFLEKKYTLKSSHGICLDCLEKAKAETLD